MNRFLFSATALVGVIASQGAWAATQTASIATSATVTTVCSLSTTAMSFGEVALTGVTNGTASVSVTCTGGGAYTVGLDNGMHAVAAQRNLVSGTTTLAYGLFQDAAFATAWNTTGAGLVSGTGNAAVQTLQVYGQIPAGQTLVSGNGTAYNDTVTVTVSY